MNPDPEITSNSPRSGTTAGTAPTTGQAAGAAHEAVDRVAENVAKAEERVREKAASGQQQLREKTASARATGERTLDQLREYTQENPMAAAAMAFTAGYLISRILNR